MLSVNPCRNQPESLFKISNILRKIISKTILREKNRLCAFCLSDGQKSFKLFVSYLSKCAKMRKEESKTKFVINFMGLNKPWLYLMAICYILVNVFVWMGNPVLPIQALAQYGWAWHHVPEILAFVFLGIYLGSLGYLSLEKISYFDSIAFVLILVASIIYALGNTVYFTAFWVVALIVLIPSFFGYLVVRLHNIRKSKANPN